VFYRRLMSVVDDFGRFDGRVTVLRSRLYPLQLDKVREADIPRWIAECEKAGLVRLYTVGGKQFILFHKLGPARAKDSKYPAPASTQAFTDVNGCAQPQADVNVRDQPYASVPYSGSGSIPDSYSGSGPASGSGGVSPPAEPFDFLKEQERQRKEFVDRWNAAGLRPIVRLTTTLQQRLYSLLGDSAWAETYPAALERAGQNPWLAQGVGRVNGPLDPADFLRDDDFSRQILAGRLDQRVVATPKSKSSSNVDAFLDTAKPT
jgi:hypothetical protein